MNLEKYFLSRFQMRFDFLRVFFLADEGCHSISEFVNDLGNAFAHSTECWLVSVGYVLLYENFCIHTEEIMSFFASFRLSEISVSVRLELCRGFPSRNRSS